MKTPTLSLELVELSDPEPKPKPPPANPLPSPAPANIVSPLTEDDLRSHGIRLPLARGER